MKTSSKFPFGHQYLRHWHVDGSEVGIVIAKAQFARSGSETFRGLPSVPEIVLEDCFEGDAANTPLLREQDCAPGKVGTDIQIGAIARTKEHAAMPDWPVRVDVERRLNYVFHVRGPSLWEPVKDGWKLSEPKPVSEVPITYSLAYGGSSAGADDKPIFASENPAGLGFTTPERLRQRDPFPAPQIGDLAEFISARAGDPMTVHGTGPIAKAWLPRRAHAGTFDEIWKQERHPRMPEDYSVRFWNAAPTFLQCSDPLDGDELITVSGISSSSHAVCVRLPSLQVYAEFSGEASETLALTLDTVQLDLLSDDPADHRMKLIWRGHVSDPARFEAVELHAERVRMVEAV